MFRSVMTVTEGCAGPEGQDDSGIASNNNERQWKPLLLLGTSIFILALVAFGTVLGWPGLRLWPGGGLSRATAPGSHGPPSQPSALPVPDAQPSPSPGRAVSPPSLSVTSPALGSRGPGGRPALPTPAGPPPAHPVRTQMPDSPVPPLPDGGSGAPSMEPGVVIPGGPQKTPAPSVSASPSAIGTGSPAPSGGQSS